VAPFLATCLALFTAVGLTSGCGDDDETPASGGGDTGRADAGVRDTAGEVSRDTSVDDVSGDPDGSCPDTEYCEAEGLSCVDDLLVECVTGAGGCLEETVTDCTEVAGGYCDSSGVEPVCAVEDPCAGVTNCDPTDDSYCDGDTLVGCLPDEDGCYVTSQRNCAAEGLSCVSSGGEAACLSETVCPEAVPIDCDSGTISGDTADGTSIFASYDPDTCSTFDYAGPEALYAFQNATAAEVTISVTETGASGGDYDLFAMTGVGVACGPALACIDEASTFSSDETVVFAAAAEERVIISYDLFTSASETTTTYDLEVACVVAVCGDGTIFAGEECDDGDSDDDDGCSSVCLVEDGYTCFGEPSTCVSGGGTCDDPIRITSGTFEFSTEGAGNNHGNYAGSCTSPYSMESPADDVVLVASVPARGIIEVSLDGLGWDEVVALVTDCAASSTSCQSFGDVPADVSWGNASDEARDIFIIADGYSSSAYGPFVVEVEIREVVCGDGVIEAEECDDGDSDDDDGCSSDCAIEDGWACFGEPSDCFEGSGVCPDPMLAGEGSYRLDTTAFSNDHFDYAGDCSGAPVASGRDIALAVEVPGRTVLEVDMDGVIMDEVVAIATGCSDASTTCAAYGDDPGFARWFNAATDPTTVYVIADGFDADEYGEFDLDIVFVPVECGDGVVDGDEVCDDGDEVPDNGCSNDCEVNEGYTCRGEPSVCITGAGTCGDPFVIEAGSFPFESDGFANDHHDYGGDCSDASGTEADGPDVVYAIDVPPSTVLDVLVSGTAFDEVVAIVSECNSSSLSCEDYGDDPPEASLYNSDAAVTEARYVIVDGFDSDELGAYTLEVDLTPVVCGDGIINGDEVCDDENGVDDDGCTDCTVDVDYTCVGEPSFCYDGEGICDSPIVVRPGTFRFDTTGYGDDHGDYGGDCSSVSAPGPDITFSINVPSNHILEVVVDDEVVTDWDAVVAVTTGCDDSSATCASLGDDPPEASFHNTGLSTEKVYIIVDGYWSYSDGPFDLSVDLHEVVCGDGRLEGEEVCDDDNTADLDGCDASCEVETDYTCWGEPSICLSGSGWSEDGDVCGEAIAINPGHYELSTSGFENDYDDYLGECGTDRSGAGPDRVFSIEVPAGKRLDVDIDGLSGFDEVAVIADGCPDVVNACLDYDDPGSASVVNDSATDQLYYIVADGYFDTSVGSFTLDVAIVDP
jgi:cysteine-rich repeat protein